MSKNKRNRKHSRQNKKISDYRAAAKWNNIWSEPNPDSSKEQRNVHP